MPWSVAQGFYMFNLVSRNPQRCEINLWKYFHAVKTILELVYVVQKSF